MTLNNLPPDLVITVITLIGLAIGSFLNVVIVRYPIMLQRSWRRECQQILQDGLNPQQSDDSVDEHLSLSKPRSHCPQCKTPIKVRHNIPVLSYLWLRGKCANCERSISPVYPITEVICALLSGLAAYHFGWSWSLLYALFFLWSTLVLFAIDLRTQLLPDNITLTLLWLGLFANLNNTFTSLSSAVIGAILGYGILWVIAKAFQAIRKKEGMGHGDFKMLAMLGAWFGWQLIPLMLLTAVILCLLVSLGLLFSKKITADKLIPFGPFLAIAGWLALFAPNVLLSIFTNLMS